MVPCSPGKRKPLRRFPPPNFDGGAPFRNGRSEYHPTLLIVMLFCVETTGAWTPGTRLGYQRYASERGRIDYDTMLAAKRHTVAFPKRRKAIP